MVSIYLIHGDPEIHPDPDEFRPERFLNGTNLEQTGAWIPFGGGVRRCLGAGLPSYEMAVVLRTMLEEATLSAVDTRPEPVARRRFTFSPGGKGRALVEDVPPGVTWPTGSKRFKSPVRAPHSHSSVAE